MHLHSVHRSTSAHSPHRNGVRHHRAGSDGHRNRLVGPQTDGVESVKSLQPAKLRLVFHRPNECDRIFTLDQLNNPLRQFFEEDAHPEVIDLTRVSPEVWEQLQVTAHGIPIDFPLESQPKSKKRKDVFVPALHVKSKSHEVRHRIT